MLNTIRFMGQSIEPTATHVFSRGVQVTTSELKSLKLLPNLRGLSLNTTDTNDDHLRVIAELITLEDLDLSLTDITDVGINHLHPLQRLTNLRIKENAITDIGLRNLQPLRSLEWLNLKCLDISDLGLQYLADLPNLSYVVFSNPKFSRDGLVNLQNKLPKCEFVVQDSPWRWE